MFRIDLLWVAIWRIDFYGLKCSESICNGLKYPRSICYELKRSGSIFYRLKYPGSIFYGLKCSESICHGLKNPGSNLSSRQGCNFGGGEFCVRPGRRSPRNRILAVASGNFRLNLRRSV